MDKAIKEVFTFHFLQFFLIMVGVQCCWAIYDFKNLRAEDILYAFNWMLSDVAIVYSSVIIFHRSTTFEFVSFTDLLIWLYSIGVAAGPVYIHYGEGWPYFSFLTKEDALRIHDLLVSYYSVMMPTFTIFICYSFRLNYIHQVRGLLPHNLANIKDRVFLVTGANSGIGYTTALELAKLDAKVIMACRNKETGLNCLAKIKNEASNPDNISMEELDLNSFKSVVEFAKKVKEKHATIDVLINNAGLLASKREVTKDGYESMLQVNFLSQFLLTELLLPVIEKSTLPGGGRIVNVTSSTSKFPLSLVHRYLLYPRVVVFDRIEPFTEKQFTTFHSYANSKLGYLMTGSQMRKIAQAKNSNVSFYYVNPGTVDTNIVRNFHPIIQYLRNLAKPLWINLWKTPLVGAYTSIHVAASKQFDSKEEKEKFYFENCRAVEFPDFPEDEARKTYEWARDVIAPYLKPQQ